MCSAFPHLAKTTTTGVALENNPISYHIRHLPAQLPSPFPVRPSFLSSTPPLGTSPSYHSEQGLLLGLPVSFFLLSLLSPIVFPQHAVSYTLSTLTPFPTFLRLFFCVRHPASHDTWHLDLIHDVCERHITSPSGHRCLQLRGRSSSIQCSNVQYGMRCLYLIYQKGQHRASCLCRPVEIGAFIMLGSQERYGPSSRLSQVYYAVPLLTMCVASMASTDYQAPLIILPCFQLPTLFGIHLPRGFNRTLLLTSQLSCISRMSIASVMYCSRYLYHISTSFYSSHAIYITPRLHSILLFL